MSLNDPKPKKERKTLGKALRRQKVIEYAAQGLTNDAIAKKLGVDEKTIDRDMKSVQIQDYIHDLVKRQVQDIEASKPLVRLQFRGDLLDKLLPRKPAVNVDVNVQNQASASVGANTELAEYAAVIQEVAASNGHIPKVCAEESVDSKASSSGDGEKRADT